MQIPENRHANATCANVKKLRGWSYGARGLQSISTLPRHNCTSLIPLISIEFRRATLPDQLCDMFSAYTSSSRNRDQGTVGEWLQSGAIEICFDPGHFCLYPVAIPTNQVLLPAHFRNFVIFSLALLKNARRTLAKHTSTQEHVIRMLQP